MEEHKVYIKIEQSNIVRNKKIFLSDIAKIYCQETDIAKKVGQICVMTVDNTQDAKFAFSIMKIVDLISRNIKNVTVVNMGEPDFVICYEIPRQHSETMKYIKALIIALIVFFGAAFTIMTFNEDVSVGKIFEMVYKLFGAKSVSGYKVMEIAYSIGLFAGIMIFFNHFSRKATHMDPTPLQIEMRNYEKDMNTAIISQQSREGKIHDI